MRIAIVGAGVFGLAAACELAARGHAVTVLDPGPIPHPLAESTDLSKVVRLDYGADETYAALGEDALAGWRRWNAERHAAGEPPLYHETGVTFLARAAMQPGGFEHDSYATLRRRGHALERLDAAAIARRFPAYRPGALVDGYYNPAGGWADASATVRFLADRARRTGAALRAARVVAIADDGVRVAADDARGAAGDARGAAAGDARGAAAGDARDAATGDARGAAGDPRGAAGDPHDAAGDARGTVGDTRHVAADLVIVCAGAWVPRLVPALAGALRAVGQPVFHLRPADPAPFAAARFPVFGADIARTGYYGFPATAGGIVKIANHGAGVPVADDRERVTTPAHEAALRAFLADTFPALAAAPIVHTRLCVYCDTVDGHFWIAPDPARPRLVIATGGSGHAFKFAPALGPLIADLATGLAHPLADRFRWRPELAARARGDAARHT